MRLFSFLFCAMCIIPGMIFSQEETLTWPREIETKEGLVTVFQPQIESFVKDSLQGRMAISIKPPKSDMLFCAAWFKALVSTDFDERTVTLESVEISRLYFPDMDDEAKIGNFKDILKQKFESWDIVMSLDHLLAGLDEVEDLKSRSVKLKNDPPDIYFRTFPTTLISIDGDPIWTKIDNSKLTYVVNTAFFIVKEPDYDLIYIAGGKFWYVSSQISDGWTETEKVPAEVRRLAEENLRESETDSITAAITKAPALLVVTKPSELILTDGQPDYAAIQRTSLLYVKNSENDIIMDIKSQEHYILLAGRWYYSKSLKDGDWKFCQPSDLPADFAKIPEDSEMSSARASIPGTPEAQNALLEQSIPQTATVDRKTATVEVSYDGNPEFKQVEGTEVAYAVNTAKTVLRIHNRYYCVDGGIWFVSGQAIGPWVVSDVRPDEVDQLPSSSEVYNVRYVYIYDSTPDFVYTGYYPGYTYSYVYDGIVVYGSGYWYRPWYRRYYYPRPVTWGYGVHWNPVTGWGFEAAYYYGWIGWGFHPYSGWWGPRGYRYGYRYGYNSEYHRGYFRGARAGYLTGHAIGSRNPSHNIYRDRTSGIRHTRTISRRSVNVNKTQLVRPSVKPNNVYTDKQGNVLQRNANGTWERKSNVKDTKQVTPRAATSERKSEKKNTVNTDQSKKLEKSYQSRERGSSNYNRSRGSAPSKSNDRSGKSKSKKR